MVDAPASPTPPKDKMELDGVPRLGDLVVMSEEQRAKFELAMNPPPRMFVGEVMKSEAVGIAPNAVDQGITHLSDLKIAAANADIASLAAGKTLEGRTRPTYGNDGVNHVEHPTRVDAVSAAANILQNLALIAKEHPEQAKTEPTQAAVKAGLDLQDKLKHTSGPIDAEADLKALGDGLQSAATATGYVAKDNKGQAVKVEDYIKERSAEMKTGAALPKEKTKALTEADKDKGLDQVIAEGISLHRGDHGKAVKELQAKLHIKEDGDFGPAMQKAVLQMQKEATLSGAKLGDSGVRHDGVDGDFGSQSAEYLSKAPPPTPAVPKPETPAASKAPKR